MREETMGDDTVLDGNDYHIPVMLSEVEEYLVNNDSGTYMDCTLGGGGHSKYLLSKYSHINIIGIDCDIEAIDKAKNELSEYSGRIRFVNDNYSWRHRCHSEHEDFECHEFIQLIINGQPHHEGRTGDNSYAHP